MHLRAAPWPKIRETKGNDVSEQEDLLSRVATAHDLMHRVVNLQNRINQLSSQFTAKAKNDTKRHPVLYAIAGFLIAFTLITSTPLKAVTFPLSIPFFTPESNDLQIMVWNAVNLIVSAIVGFVFYKIIARVADKGRAQRNAAIDQSNAQIDANNLALSQAVDQTTQEIFALQQRWAVEVAPWYPMDYDNIHAVDFFLSAVRNHRAGSVQELVNLYETEMHQRRMEQGQQQILKQQRIGNMLQIGNLLMQGQVLSQAQQVNANTAAASANIDRLTRSVTGR